jgi:acetolactate synthase-1/2/3 large subunit
METIEGHGGDVALAALRAAGVEEMFTLSGGHVFPVYDAAVRQKVRIVDVRHEQTATFAAEGTAKLTRRPGLAVVTAGPGVTNSVSAVTSAYFTGVPLVVLGGRAPTVNWGRGGLQELDHVPILAPVTKLSRTATTGDDIGPVLLDAARAALTPHRGPVFVDVPMDTIFSPASRLDRVRRPAPVEPDPDAVAAVATLVAGRRGRPSSWAATSGSAGPSRRCGGRPRRCGCRCS